MFAFIVCQKNKNPPACYPEPLAIIPSLRGIPLHFSAIILFSLLVTAAIVKTIEHFLEHNEEEEELQEKLNSRRHDRFLDVLF